MQLQPQNDTDQGDDLEDEERAARWKSQINVWAQNVLHWNPKPLIWAIPFPYPSTRYWS